MSSKVLIGNKYLKGFTATDKRAVRINTKFGYAQNKSRAQIFYVLYVTDNGRSRIQ